MSADPSVDDLNEEAKDNDTKQQSQEEDDLNLPEDLTQTTPQQQRLCMKKVGLKTPNVGEYWYPIDKKWYDSWERYTMFNKGNDDIPGGIDNLHKIGEPRPGKIDNSSLQDADNAKALKKEIQENLTHIWIHEEVWKLLFSWYGGGAALPRKVFERGNTYSKEKFICIYPQAIQISYCDESTGEIKINSDDKIEQYPRDYTLKQILKDLSEENKEDDAQDNMHMWLKFGDIYKIIYPISTIKVKLTEKELETEDENKWIEVPDDYLGTKLDDISDIKGDFVIVIEKKKQDDSWPRAKGENWRETLQTGDIVDVKDNSKKWYESLIRYVYPSDDAKNSGKCMVHYIGWAIKWDEIIEISNVKRIAGRNEHSSGPHRNRGYSYNRSGMYSGYRQNETGTPDQHGVIGLRNLGNTCFMNSTIQCLAQSPQLTNYFLQNDYIHHINTNNPLGWNGRVAKAWAQLLGNMFSGKYRVIAPREFKSVIGEIAPRFMGYSQQDSQELLSFLLDGLHEDLNQIEKKPATPAVESDGRPDNIVALHSWKTYLKRNQSVVVDLLQAQYKSRIDCPDCGKISVTFDPYMFLSVPLPTEKYKIIQYTWVDCNDTSKQPITYGQKMLKIADISMLKDEVSQKHNVNKNELFVCDVWRCKIHRQLKNYDSVGHINRKSDDIFIYYCKAPAPPNDTPSDEKKNDNENNENNENNKNNNNNNNNCQTFVIICENNMSETFGYPLLITLPKEEIKINELYNKLFKIMKPFIKNNQSDKLPFELYANWGYNYSISNNGRIKLKIDNDKKFNLSNKNNLKFVIEWKDISQYKIFKRLKDESLKGTNGNGNGSKDYNPNSRGQPIELDACINAFCEKEQLSQNNAWYCNKCKDFKCASKKIDLWNSPDLLIIHLKRFCYTRVWRDRIDTLVKFPIEGLDLSPFLLDNDAKRDAIYDLYAVSNHMGGMGGGHYTAYAKNLDNKLWYHLNDSGTSKVNNMQSICSSNAYVLYYYKRKPRKLKHRASRVILPEIKEDDLK